MLAEIDSADWQGDASISSDGLMLFFASARSGGVGGTDVWYSTRATTSDLWGAPVNSGLNVNSGDGDKHPGISLAGNKLYFDRDVAGESHIFSAEIIPEPSTIMLLGILALLRRKLKK